MHVAVPISYHKHCLGCARRYYRAYSDCATYRKEHILLMNSCWNDKDNVALEIHEEFALPYAMLLTMTDRSFKGQTSVSDPKFINLPPSCFP